MIGGLAGGEGHRAHRAPMECAGKADEIRPPGVVTGQFDGGLDSFGAGVGHERLGFLSKRSNLVQFFPQGNPFFVIKIGGNMDELFGLILDGLDHFGMAVAGGDDGNPGCKIQEAVAVHIPDFGAFAVIHDKRDPTRIGWRNDSRIALDQRLGFWPW